MITENLGKIAITPKGQWVAGTYERLDMVTDAGSSYLSLKDNNVSALNTADWMLVAEKGDAFEYSDFTPEQIEVLQQPATDIASTVSQAEGLRATAESGRVTAEGLRVTAESNRAGAESLRVTAEQTRQTNTETAIQNAANATALAVEVAEHPDTIINDYWWRWNTTTNAYENTGIRAKGDVYYSTFSVNLETGKLEMTYDTDFTNTNFSINNETGQLILTI